MPRTLAPKYSDQDRSDLQSLNGAIQKALLVEIDSTLSAVQLGAYLKELKDRSLWRLELSGERGSFYRWVTQRHKIKTTMIKNYLLIGTALTAQDVSGRRISVKSLQVISKAEHDLRSYLIRLADAQQSSTKVKRALQAAREALAGGASLPEAQSLGEQAMEKRGNPKGSKAKSLSIEDALQQALKGLEALAGSGGAPNQEKDQDKVLQKVEDLAWDVLGALRKLKERQPETQTVTKQPETQTVTKQPETQTVTAVTETATKQRLWLLPLLVVASALAETSSERDSMDVEYLLRLPRPRTSVPLSMLPDVPAVPRSLTDEIERLLTRVAGLINGKKVLTPEQLDEPVKLAAEALKVARTGVLGPHPLLCAPLEWLAFLHRRRGEFAHAEGPTREILQIWQKYDTKDRGQVLEWQSCLGILLCGLGRIAEARILFTLVWQERKKRLPKNHPLLKVAEENLLFSAPVEAGAGY